MALYNTSLYNTIMFGENGSLSVEVVSKIEPEVDKYISPFYKRFFPEWMHSKYPLYLDLFRFWLEFLENKYGPYWVMSHVVELSSISTTVEDNLSRLRDQYAPDFIFEDFPQVDPRKFLQNVQSYFKIKGTEQSFRYLFRLMGVEIEIVHPIDNTLFIDEDSVIDDERIEDSYYYTPFTYDIKVELPYSVWNEFIYRLNNPAGVKMFGTQQFFLNNGTIYNPFINKTNPNKSEDPVLLMNDIGSVPAIISVDGNIEEFPDPTDPNNPSPSVITIGSEDMIYTAKDDINKTLSISTRGVNGTVERSHIDRCDFTIDLDKNYIILNERLEIYSGKICTLSTFGELPSPLQSSLNYYVKKIEISNILLNDISDVDISLELVDGSLFPESGTIYINGERISYTSKVGNVFNGLIRGIESTTAYSHNSSSNVYFIDKVLKLSSTYDDLVNLEYITLLDSGNGVFEFIGKGQEVTLFNGFNVSRPQFRAQIEESFYTSYQNVNDQFFKDRKITFNYVENVDVAIATNKFTTDTNHPFYLGETVRFIPRETYLISDIDDVVTSIDVDSTVGFNNSGYIKINNEWIQYGSKTATSFDVLIRGSLGTQPISHSSYSNIQARLFETTDGVELNGNYYTIREQYPGSLNTNDTIFQLIDNPTDKNVIDIVTDSSSLTDVALVGLGEAFSDDVEIFQPSTNSSGTISRSGEIENRTLTVDKVPGVYGNSQGYIDDAWGSDTETIVRYSQGNLISGNVKFTGSDGYQDLQLRDLQDLILGDIIDGGSDKAVRLSYRYPEMRITSDIPLGENYHIPYLTDDIDGDVNWTPDTVTPILSYNPTSIGHITLSGTGARGICRGLASSNQPIIEVYPGDWIETDNFYLGECTVTIGSDIVTGDFSSPPFPLSSNMSIRIGDDHFIIYSFTASTITIEKNYEREGFSDGDAIKVKVYMQNTYRPGNGVSTGAKRKWIGVNKGYSLSTTPKKYIKMNVTEEVDSEVNWSISDNISFNPINKGNITQLVSGAEGIIRAKNTVSSTLTSTISSIQTTIDLEDTSQFLDSGGCIVDSEIFSYNGKNSTQLLNVVRGVLQTNPSIHQIGTKVTSYNTSINEFEVYIEVTSGEFSSEVTNSCTVGDDVSSGNSVRLINNIEGVSTNIPYLGVKVSNNPVISGDPNGYRLWEVEGVYNLSDKVIFKLDDYYSLPTDPGYGNGTLNILEG